MKTFLSTDTDLASAAAVNPCSLCAPLGASIACKGIEKSMIVLHGSQGCATYIRRFLISHFREPVDIASSSFTEDTVVFGGGENLKQALANVTAQYQPSVIVVATTCLAETIGEDVSRPIREFLLAMPADDRPRIVSVSTPSYRDSHLEGFSAMTHAVASQLAEDTTPTGRALVFPGLLSPADIRCLKEVFAAFKVSCSIFPDFSDTLDDGIDKDYHLLPQGGTTIAEIRQFGGASLVFDWIWPVGGEKSASEFLNKKFDIPIVRTPPPIGIQATDRFMESVAKMCGRPVPLEYRSERGRLLDAYVDGHKYLSEKRALVFGDEPMVAALAEFCHEVGIIPVVCGTGGKSATFDEAIRAATGNVQGIQICRGATTDSLLGPARDAGVELVIGSSKGARLATELKVPLVRVGFPVHDRFGSGRLLHIGYRGTQQLLDRTINACIEHQQQTDEVAYAYY